MRIPADVSRGRSWDGGGSHSCNDGAGTSRVTLSCLSCSVPLSTGSSVAPPGHQAGATRFLAALSRKLAVLGPWHIQLPQPVSPELIWNGPQGELGEFLKPETLLPRNECMINGVAALVQLWSPFLSFPSKFLQPEML